SGLTPTLSVSRTSSTAPAREPWSVSATAGISSSAARAASAGMRHAPSRIEYSLWTCRWTKSGLTEGPLYGGPRRSHLAVVPRHFRREPPVRVFARRHFDRTGLAAKPPLQGSERERNPVPRIAILRSRIGWVDPAKRHACTRSPR